MTYASGSAVLAADYNNLAGEVLYTSPFSSSAAALNKASAIYGIGYGDIGYGQTSIALPLKTIGQRVDAADWVTLRDVISSIATHQGTTLSQLPLASYFTSGQPITPANTALAHLSNSLLSVNSNRLNYNLTGMSLLSGVASMTRATSWSTSISGSFQIAFSSEDASRFFFNSGGQIRIRFSHSSTSSVQNVLWGNLVNAVGSIVMGAHGTVITGNLNVGTAYQNTYAHNSTNTVQTNYAAGGIGYYELGTTNSVIFNGDNIGGMIAGEYAANDIYVYANANGTLSNGSRGKTIVLSFTLNDQHTNAFSDTVSAGTVAYVDIFKATGNLAGIETPTVTVLTNW
jgi:hypothetical protein